MFGVVCGFVSEVLFVVYAVLCSSILKLSTILCGFDVMGQCYDLFLSCSLAVVFLF